MPTASHAAPLAGLALRCQSDARLASLCREGHERAFEEIVRRYRPQLVSYAGAIVPAHRAEDVVQEALTKAHWSLAASQGEMKLKPWLYTIVRNRALNDLRDEPCHQHLDEDFDGVPQPPDVAAQRAELASVLAGVKSLPAAQREALLRRELEGRSHQEIAVAIGATAGAVRGLIFRARTALREAAGVLIPLPVVRALLNVGPLTTEATGAGAGAGIGGAAAGLTAGGGGGLAIKAGATLLVAGLAVGSGVAIHDRGENRDASAAMVAQHRHSPPGHTRSSGTGSSAAGSHSGSGADGDGSGRGSNHGSSSSGPGSSEGGSTSGHRSGPGGGDDGSDGHGGPGDEGSGSGRHGDGEPSGHEGSNDTSGHSGSGSSGHGGSAGTSGEGSGGGSGTSGSSSGSGSGSSGSGSGSSGSGDVGGGSGSDGGSGSSHEGGDVTTLDAEPSP